MPDPCLFDAIEVVDQMTSMPPAEATRYLLVRYGAADPQFKEAMIAALSMALLVAKRRVSR